MRSPAFHAAYIPRTGIELEMAETTGIVPKEKFDEIYEKKTDEWSIPNVNELLIKSLPKLTGGRTNLDLFLPLCGKSLDMVWLADKGHSVTGVEWSELAIKQFFEETKLEYTAEPCMVGST